MNRSARLAGYVASIAGVDVLIALTVFGHSSEGWLVLDIVVGVLASATIPVMGRWPVPTAAVLTVLVLLSPAATPPASAAALNTAQRRRLRVAAAVGVAGVAAHAVQAYWRGGYGLAFGWWLALVAASYAALIGWGIMLRVRRELVWSLTERAERAEAEQGRRVIEARLAERTRIAREMHDVLAHRLSLLATYAGALEYRPDAPPERLAEAAGVVRSGIHQALDELRAVITVLRDDDPDGDGDRPQPGLADIPRLVEEAQQGGTNITLSDRTTESGALPAALGRAAYRIVQEGLTNARKHAVGEPVDVVLDGVPGGTLEINLRNRVPVTAGAPTVPGAGMGLLGLSERAQLAGGTLEYDADGEFTLRASLPWPR